MTTRVLLSILFTALAVSAATITIDTAPQWNGSDYIHQFGVPDTQTYGQIIVAPDGTTKLLSFSITLMVPAALDFRGAVYAWTGAMATGPSLWESATVHTSDDDAFETILFSGLNIDVTAGQQYVLFITSSLDNGDYYDVGGNDLLGIVAGVSDDPSAYPHGNFVFMNNGNNTSQWTNQTWSQWYDYDMAMTVTFADGAAETPEPGTSLLLGLGLASLAALRRHRNRTRPENAPNV